MFARLRFAVVLVLALSLFLAGMGCSKSTSQESTGTSSAPTPAPPQVSPSVAAQPAPAPSAVASAPEPAAQGGALASQPTEWSNIQCDILQLKRASGDSVDLRFSFRNTGQEKFKMDNYALGGWQKVDNVYLMDPMGKKKYLIIKDSDQNPLGSSGFDSEIQPGQSLMLWAKFPAPPADVQKLTVVIPHAPPFDDVPLSQ